jgi:dihydroorotase
MVGLESALSVVQATLVETGHATWKDVARLLSVTPAAIGQVGGYAAPLHIGTIANITLVDPTHREVWSPSRLHGLSTNSPFVGDQLPGRVVSTLFRGQQSVIDGVLVDSDEMRMR